MDPTEFNPFVRFYRRRLLSLPYPHPVYAYDFRLFYVIKGKLTLEENGNDIPLEEFSMITIPPGVGYRLVTEDTPAEIFILNFDFDSTHSALPVHAPDQQESFSPAEIISQSCIPPFDTVFHLLHAPELESALQELCSPDDTSSHALPHIQSALLKYVLSKAIHLSNSKKHRDTKNPQIQAIKDYVEHQFAHPINNQTIALEMGYHPHYLNTFFLHAEGMTIHTYIEKTRLRHAQHLLMTTQSPIGEIAEACGFLDASYFTKFFIRHTGMPPKRYREFSM
jgi:AraC-like DNA-binding protein